MHNIKSPKYSMHFLLMSGLKGRDLAFFVAGTWGGSGVADGFPEWQASGG